MSSTLPLLLIRGLLQLLHLRQQLIELCLAQVDVREIRGGEAPGHGRKTVGDQPLQSTVETLSHALDRLLAMNGFAVGPVKVELTANDAGIDVDQVAPRGLRAERGAARLRGRSEQRGLRQRAIELTQVIEAHLGLR